MDRVFTLLLILTSIFPLYKTTGVKPLQREQEECESSKFRCTDGKCISHSWRCDHTADCEDGSDEESCDQDECEVNNGGCSHRCVDLALGFVCECPPGMKLVHDTQCEEVDPCLDADVCDQVCVRSNSSFTCECAHGYLKSSENGRCQATGGAAVLVLSTSDGLVSMDPSGSDQKKITGPSGSPGSVSALSADHTLYWSDPEHSLIYRRALDQTDQMPAVLFSAASGIMGLGVDWIHRRLYWISNSTGSLHRADLNGSDRREIVTGLSSPTALVLQPLLGLVFWASAGVSPRIQRSGLDGLDWKPIIISAIQNPASLTLDLPRGLLYWTDSGLKTVSRVTYDGQQRKTVVEPNSFLEQPAGLAVFESRVYWIDGLTGSICSADKHWGKLLQVIKISSRSPAGFIIYHPLLQPTVSDATNSPAQTSTVDAKPASFTWILPLIGFLLALLVALLVSWRCSSRTGTSASALSRFGGSRMKESRDPLVPPQFSRTRSDKQEVPV